MSVSLHLSLSLSYCRATQAAGSIIVGLIHYILPHQTSHWRFPFKTRAVRVMMTVMKWWWSDDVAWYLSCGPAVAARSQQCSGQLTDWTRPGHSQPAATNQNCRQQMQHNPRPCYVNYPNCLTAWPLGNRKTSPPVFPTHQRDFQLKTNHRNLTARFTSVKTYYRFAWNQHWNLNISAEAENLP